MCLSSQLDCSHINSWTCINANDVKYVLKFLRKNKKFLHCHAHSSQLLKVNSIAAELHLNKSVKGGFQLWFGGEVFESHGKNCLVMWYLKTKSYSKHILSSKHQVIINNIQSSFEK
jgi:hypothetical protein